MKEVNYWQQFASTGKPEDYLTFKNSEREERPGAANDAGDSSYAGTHNHNGNNIEDRAYRGIR